MPEWYIYIPWVKNQINLNLISIFHDDDDDDVMKYYLPVMAQKNRWKISNTKNSLDNVSDPDYVVVVVFLKWLVWGQSWSIEH